MVTLGNWRGRMSEDMPLCDFWPRAGRILAGCAPVPRATGARARVTD